MSCIHLFATGLGAASGVAVLGSGLVWTFSACHASLSLSCFSAHARCSENANLCFTYILTSFQAAAQSKSVQKGSLGLGSSRSRNSQCWFWKSKTAALVLKSNLRHTDSVSAALKCCRWVWSWAVRRAGRGSTISGGNLKLIPSTKLSSSDSHIWSSWFQRAFSSKQSSVTPATRWLHSDLIKKNGSFAVPESFWKQRLRSFVHTGGAAFQCNKREAPWALTSCFFMILTNVEKKEFKIALPTLMNTTFNCIFFLIKCRWFSVVLKGSNEIVFVFMRRLQHLMDICVRLAQICHNMWCCKVKWTQLVWRRARPRTTCRMCLTLCMLQGASEDAPPKKEKVDKGNENYQKVKEVSISTSIFLFFADPLPPNTCQSFHLGGACILLGFIIMIYFWWWCILCCCCLWLHQWWLLLLRIMFKD